MSKIAKKLTDLIGNTPFNNNELIRAKSKKLSEQE